MVIRSEEEGRPGFCANFPLSSMITPMSVLCLKEMRKEHELTGLIQAVKVDPVYAYNGMCVLQWNNLGRVKNIPQTWVNHLMIDCPVDCREQKQEKTADILHRTPIGISVWISR